MIIQGQIEDDRFKDARVTIDVERANGDQVTFAGVVVLDERCQPVDTLPAAYAVLNRWCSRRRSGETPYIAPHRISLFEFLSEKGASRTTYIEPEDRVLVFGYGGD